MFFVLVGNGRTGSTWLQTMLDQLPDVRAWSELKLYLSYQEPHPLHHYIDERTNSIARSIERACASDDAPAFGPRLVLGSKLIFDPYGYVEPAIFDFLNSVLERDIRPVVLTRSYASQFLSWKVRGVHHRLNPDAVVAAKDIDAKFVDEVSRWSEPKLSNLVLTSDGRPMPGAEHVPAEDASIPYPIEDAIENLLVFFYNDLKALDMVRRSHRYLVIDYAEIGERFGEIARFVGSRASAQDVTCALHQPLTQRLPSLDAERVQPAGILEAFSHCLGHAFRRKVEVESAPEPWRWRGNRRFIELAVPDLGDLFERYGLMRDQAANTETGATRDGSLLLWRRRRPFYGFQLTG